SSARRSRVRSNATGSSHEDSHCVSPTLGRHRIGPADRLPLRPGDRKSTRLNSSHVSISYAVFCLKKKKKNQIILTVLLDRLIVVHVARGCCSATRVVLLMLR